MIARALFLGLLLPLVLSAAEGEAERIRFTSVDVYVDSGSQALAAYQVEFKATAGQVKIVGIEGGDHAAFQEPPFYDPRAMQQERAILAAFSTARDLPKGRTRVATVHVQVTGEVTPEWTVKLTTAGNPQGKKITATAEAKERTRP